MDDKVANLRLSDFDYTLPHESIAQAPVIPRDFSCLMVINPQPPSIAHHHFYNLVRWLNAGDVLVLNATRVLPARLRGTKPTGGKVDVLLLRQISDNRWQALVHGSFAPGAGMVFPEGLCANLEERLENGEWIMKFSDSNIRNYLDRHGEMPLPPYIKRNGADPGDLDNYQTVYARAEGSIAAPTAGFHFTPTLIQALRAQGVEFVEIILHVGWGTFRPVRSENIEEHVMLPEHYQVTEEAAGQLTKARQEGRRIIAVGTTVVRTLESVYQEDQKLFRSGTGQTNLFIYPGYQFRAIDSLITNFHLPHSTPLFLASAFYSHKLAGTPARRSTDSPPPPFSLREVYEEAIDYGYRFYSYGDAMLIL